MTPENEQQQIQDPSIQAEAMVQHELMPTPDQLLQDPTQLQLAVRQPGVLYEQAVKNGVEEEVAEQQVTALKEEVMRKLIAPEGLAESSRTVAERLSGDIQEIVMHAERTVSMVTDELDAGLRKSGQVSEALYDARRSMSVIREFLDQGRPEDLEMAQHAARRLWDFQEVYAGGRRAIANAYEDGTHGVRSAATVLEQGQESTGRAFRTIAELEARADASPDDMYFEGVEAKVAQRGATTAAEHEQQCEAEVTRYDQFVGGTSQEVRQASEAASQLVMMLSRSAASELPVANRLSDGIDYLSSSLYRIAEHGPEMKRFAREAFEELDMQMRRIESGMAQVATDGVRDKQQLEELQHKLRGVRQRAEIS